MEAIIYIEIIFAAIVSFYLLYTIAKYSKIDIFSPIYVFPLFYIIYLSIGSSNLFMPHEHEITEKQWILYLIGLLFFYLGSLIPLIHAKTSKIQPNFTDIIWDKKKLLQITSIIFVIAITTRLLIYMTTGIPLFASNVNIARQLAAENGYLGILGISTETVFIISFAAYLIFKKNRRLFLLFMFISLVLSILTGSRQSLVRILFPCLIFYHYYKKRIPLKFLLIASLIATIFIGSIGFYRRNIFVKSVTNTSLTERNFNPYLFWAPYALRELRLAPEGLARVLESIPEKANYQYGKFHLSPLLMPLPGEQLPPDMIFKKIVGGEWAGFGMASTLLAPQYADFGIIGIMTGMFLIGFILVHLYLKTINTKNPLYTLLYGVVLVQMLIAVRSNYLNFVIIWTIFLLIIIHLFSLKKAHIEDNSKIDIKSLQGDV